MRKSHDLGIGKGTRAAPTVLGVYVPCAQRLRAGLKCDAPTALGKANDSPISTPGFTRWAKSWRAYGARRKEEIQGEQRARDGAARGSRLADFFSS